MKIRKYTQRDGYTGEGYLHYCPACECAHAFAVEAPFHNNARWTFDGNYETPTFQPSMNIRIGPFPSDDDEPGRIEVCHYFLRNGKIQYLADCTHDLKGQTVDLPDLPVKYLIGIET